MINTDLTKEKTKIDIKCNNSQIIYKKYIQNSSDTGRLNRKLPRLGYY